MLGICIVRPLVKI